MEYLIVENDIVTNIIVCGEDFAKDIGAFPSYVGVKIGESYNPKTEPTPEQDMMNMLVEQEYQITLLQLGL